MPGPVPARVRVSPGSACHGVSAVRPPPRPRRRVTALVAATLADHRIMSHDVGTNSEARRSLELRPVTVSRYKWPSSLSITVPSLEMPAPGGPDSEAVRSGRPAGWPRPAAGGWPRPAAGGLPFTRALGPGSRSPWHFSEDKVVPPGAYSPDCHSGQQLRLEPEGEAHDEVICICKQESMAVDFRF